MSGIAPPIESFAKGNKKNDCRLRRLNFYPKAARLATKKCGFFRPRSGIRNSLPPSLLRMGHPPLFHGCAEKKQSEGGGSHIPMIW